MPSPPRAPRRAQFLLAALSCAVAAQALAGAQFSAVTRNENSGTRLPAFGNATVEGSVDGERARLEYRESGSGSLPKGSILVTTDGARTAKLYDTKEQTCGDVPLPGSASSGMRAQATSRYENIEVKKVLDEKGPTLHGTGTRHLRYATTYDVHSLDPSAKVLHGTIESELWVAPALGDAAFALWLQAAPHTGNPDADGKIAAGMGEAKGAALKRIQRTSLHIDGGAEQTSTSTMEVTRLSTARPSPNSLEPPFECRIGPSKD